MRCDVRSDNMAGAADFSDCTKGNFALRQTAYLNSGGGKQEQTSFDW